MGKVVAEARLEGEPLGVPELKGIDLFADVQERQLEMYPGTVSRRRFRAGEVICREGEGGTTAFYIVEGEVDVSIRRRSAAGVRRRAGLMGGLGRLFGKSSEGAAPTHASGTLIPIDASVDLTYGDRTATLTKGQWFGEMSCLNLEPRSATVVARTDCELVEILRNMWTILQSSKSFKERADKTYRERALGAHLKNVPFLEDLPDEVLREIGQRAELVAVDAGTVIIKEGDPADGMYIIRSGQVRVSKLLPGGEITLRYLSKGDNFGEIGLLRATRRSTTCTAVDHPVTEGGRKRRRARVELVKLKTEDMERLMTAHPKVRQHLEAQAARRELDTAGAARGAQTDAVPARVEELGLLQGQRLLLIDLEKCTRCDQCVDACVGSHEDGVSRLVREGPRYDKYLVPSRCRMCRDPVCMIGCPVASIRKAENLNIVIEDWCVGCGVCAKQCPYDSIQMHDMTEFDEVNAEGLPYKDGEKDRAVVCDQCSSLPGAGPACVYACPHDAAFYVDGREFFTSLSVSAASRAASSSAGGR